ncbi:MAG: class I SAM-dependent methyltransferase [Deltaproteobacteria bacterium]|nr:class I SAM-dependent methyltransferase [Deltaproteobacteria bacterium]
MTTQPQIQPTQPAVLPTNIQDARTWGAGGEKYDQVSRGIADAIDHAVDALDPQPGEHILDVATGTGWAARRIAQRGATVTGVDLGEEVIEAAKALSTGIDFRVGDAEALPFPDNHFDAVISTFGVMFARDPEAVARELGRVVRPGGRISLANWAIGGTVHDMFQLIRSYKPAEANPAPSPFEWGSAGRVTELLGDRFDVEFESGTSFFRPESGEQAWATFSVGFGPVVTLLEVLSEEKAEALKNEFIDFHEAHRIGSGIVMRRPYVIAKATRVNENERAS